MDEERHFKFRLPSQFVTKLLRFSGSASVASCAGRA